MYLSLGTEGRRVFNSKNSTFNVDEISTRNLWDVLNKSFIRIHNITFDRYLFLTRKQQKGETIEKFYGHLKELSEDCDLGEKGDTIIRDVFIANMQNEDIQKELLNETVEPDKALAIAINIEMGTLNQLQMNANKTELHSTFNRVQRMRIANATPFSTMNTTARKKPTNCHFFGMSWTPEHCNRCLARGKKCNNCGIENHFAKDCRKPKDSNSYPKTKPRVNNVQKDYQTEDVNQISADFDPDLESNYSSDEDNCVASVSSVDFTTPVEAVNLVFGNTATNVLVDSGSVCTIIKESLADSIISQDPNSKWIRQVNPKQLKNFFNEPIQTLGILQTSIQSNNWYANPIEIQVVADGHRSLLGRDLFPALELSIQQANNQQTVNQLDQEYCSIKKQIATDFPDLITKTDANTVPADDFLDGAGWFNPKRSDLEIEKTMCRAQQVASRRYRDSDNKESRFIIHPKLTDPIPRTEKSLNVKLARKLPNKKRAKRQLAGIYEVLQPGSFVTKSSPTTTIINEPGRSPVKVRDSDLAKFGTKAERSTNLWTYAQRCPAPYEQTTETKIAKHSYDLKKQKCKTPT